MDDCKQSTKMISMAVIVTLALFTGIICLHYQPIHGGTLHRWKQTKTLHSSQSFDVKWMSLMPTTPYLDNAEGFEVSAYLPVHTDDEASESQVMYLSGDSWSILSSIAPNVYISTLLFIYVMYGFHVLTSVSTGWYFLKPEFKPYYFGVLVLVWYVTEFNNVIFSKWYDITWKPGGDSSVTIRYDVEGSQVSVLYSGIIITLYAFHLCVKNGFIKDLYGNDTKDYQQLFPRLGDIDSTLLVSLSLFLLTCTCIGMKRSVILETEAQLILACALSIGVLEYFSATICSYFYYIHVAFIIPLGDTQNASTKEEQEYNRTHGIFMFNLCFLVQALVLIANSLLLVILIGSLSDLAIVSPGIPVFWIYIIIMGIVYVGKKIYELFQTYQKRKELQHAPNEETQGEIQTHELWWDKWKTTHAENLEKMATIQNVIVAILMFVLSVTILNALVQNDLHATNLMNDETYQYLSLDRGTPPNSYDLCKDVTSNNVMTKISDSTCAAEKPKDKFKVNSQTPMDLKVYAWTHWWRSLEDPVENKKNTLCVTCQKVDTFFCSTGFEPKAGKCKRESDYDRSRKVPEKWNMQSFITSNRS